MKKNYLTLILPSLLSGCAGISGGNNVAPSVDWPPESPDNQYHLNK